MKKMRIETGTTIEIVSAGESSSYPIASIPGSRGGGWFTRIAPESTVVVTCAPVDSISGGFALPLATLFRGLNLCDATAAETTIATLETEIAALQRRIKKGKK
jgi:hypothetical protein